MPINLSCLCVWQVLFCSLWIYAVVLSGWLAHPDLISLLQDLTGIELRMPRGWISQYLLLIHALFLLFHSIFLPLTNLDTAEHWAPIPQVCRALSTRSSSLQSTEHPLLMSAEHWAPAPQVCRALSTHSSGLDVCFAYLCSFTSLHHVLIYWLGQLRPLHLKHMRCILPKESTHTRSSLQCVSAVLDNLISSIYPCNPTFSYCPSLSALGHLTLLFKWRNPFSSSTHTFILH